MKNNTKLRLVNDLENFFSHVILVEGKKDVSALKALGFEKVYDIHKNSIGIRERIEEIGNLISKNDRVCILADFDSKGNQLHIVVKEIIQELGFKIDLKLRGLLINAGISHIEGLDTFIGKIENL